MKHKEPGSHWVKNSIFLCKILNLSLMVRKNIIEIKES